MASLSSFSIFFLLLIFFALSIPAQSQKTQLSRRNLALTDQDQSQEQPTIPKPSTKKKKVSQADQQEEEQDQPILKSTSKKKKLASEQEQEEESIPKPTTKKKKPDPIEQEDQSISSSKSTTKKKKFDQEEDQSNTKSTTKTKKQDPIDQEEEPIPKPTIKKKKLPPIEQEDDQPNPKPTIKKKKLAPVEQQEDQANPKLTTKKKKLSPIDPEQDQPISKSTTENNKNSTFGSKNQTKSLKPKKSNSTSTSTSTQIPISSASKSKPNKTQTLKPSNSTATTKPKSKPIDPIWLEEPDSDSDPDLIAEFRDLPTRIHEALLPDLKKISITSKAYIYKANKNIAENMKPFVGNKFAPKFALAFSCVFLVLPLCLVAFLFYHLNSYLSLQRFLIFVQAYLAIYFFTLSVTAVVTGLEPLRFFYATSPASYAWTQAVQTLGYLLYLLVQLIHLVVVFSAGENKVGVRVLGLVQMIVGLAVGGHYYAAVFHRAVTGEAPRANWKVHGVYAGCFLLICLCARAERVKKAYDGGEDGKKS